MARFPIKDVTAWLGNSEAVAMKHYAMELEESFQAAAESTGKTASGKLGEELTPLGGCISGVPDAISRDCQKEKPPVYAGKTGSLIFQDSTGGYWLMGDEGLEGTPEHLQKPAGGGAIEIDLDLATLITNWPELPQHIRETILTLISVH